MTALVELRLARAGTAVVKAIEELGTKIQIGGVLEWKAQGGRGALS